MTDAAILFVDDEAGFVETMAKRLSRRNFQVHKAFDGDAAMDVLAHETAVDVVVLDMKMPGRGGLSVLKEIRRDYPLVEVIMLTGHGTVESAIEGMQAGAYDYLLKPCDLEELTDRIRGAVSRKQEREGRAVEERVSGIASSRP